MCSSYVQLYLWQGLENNLGWLSITIIATPSYFCNFFWLLINQFRKPGAIQLDLLKPNITYTLEIKQNNCKKLTHDKSLTQEKVQEEEMYARNFPAHNQLCEQILHVATYLYVQLEDGSQIIIIATGFLSEGANLAIAHLRILVSHVCMCPQRAVGSNHFLDKITTTTNSLTSTPVVSYS